MLFSHRSPCYLQTAAFLTMVSGQRRPVCLSWPLPCFHDIKAGLWSLSSPAAAPAGLPDWLPGYRSDLAAEDMNQIFCDVLV